VAQTDPNVLWNNGGALNLGAGAAAGGAYLPLAGGEMTGAIAMSATARLTSSLDAAGRSANIDIQPADPGAAFTGVASPQVRITGSGPAPLATIGGLVAIKGGAATTGLIAGGPVDITGGTSSGSAGGSVEVMGGGGIDGGFASLKGGNG